MNHQAQFFERIAMREPGRVTTLFEVGGHSPHLVHRLFPGELSQHSVANGLGEPDPVGEGPFVLVDEFEEGLHASGGWWRTER